MRARSVAVAAGLAASTAVVWLLEGRTTAAGLLGTALVAGRFWGRRTQVVRRPRRRRVWTDEERRFILDRDGWACVTCRSTDELEIDHIVPFSRGGACSVGNAQVLCGPCNRRKGAS